MNIIKTLIIAFLLIMPCAHAMWSFDDPYRGMKKKDIALWQTIYAGDEQGVKDAIANGADVNYERKIPGVCEDVPLYMAILFGREKKLAICKALCEAGANVNYRLGAKYFMGELTGGNTPLMYAAEFVDNIELSQLLLHYGADIFLRIKATMIDAFDKTALSVAVHYRNMPVCEFLVKKMLSIITPTKPQEIRSLLCCFKKNFSGQYSNLRNIFEHFFLRERFHANAAQALEQVNVLPDNEMKKYLYAKYFPNVKQN